MRDSDTRPALGRFRQIAGASVVYHNMHYASYGRTDQDTSPRLPAKAILALQILQREPGGLYGLDVVARSNGRLGPASIYIVLGDLEGQGLVSAKRAAKPGWIPRPLYTISAQGLRALADWELRASIHATYVP